MTYRTTGTNPYQPGKGRWSFKWKAPDQAVGRITFYTAGISANNDATDDGDLVYTKTLVIDEKQLTVNAIPQGESVFTVFPNPVRDYMRIQLNRSIAGPLAYSLYDAAGRLISHLPERNISADGRTITCSLKDLVPGVYYLNIRGSALSETRKVFLID